MRYIAAVLFITLLFSGRHPSIVDSNFAGRADARRPTPMIVQDNEGDHLVHRAGPLRGVPLDIKVDGAFGGSEDFFAFSEVLPAGQTIPFHMHENAEELLIFHDSGAQVIVGEKRGRAGVEAIVFIPRDTWISAKNATTRDIRLLAIFSRHGFDSYIRAISAKPGERLTAMSPDEFARLRVAGHAMYWDYSKGAYPPGVAHWD